MHTERSAMLLPLVLGAVVALAGCSSGNPAPTPTAPRTVTGEPSSSAQSPTSTPVASTSSSTPSSGGTTAASSCTPVGATAATEAAVAELPAPVGLPDARWDARYAIAAAYEPCAALSAVVVPIDGATASSPNAILLFHEGRYLGTATKEQYPFVPDVARESGAVIAVTYHWVEPGESDAEASGRTSATFSWDPSTGKVVMRGGVPPLG